MQYQVYKIHSDFYYVEDKQHNTYTCKLRDVLKKQKIEVVVGDFVELSDDFNFITGRKQRKNAISRPKASNIDIALVVESFKEPQLDYIQLNRYLTYLKYLKIDAVICINKEDLENNLAQKVEEIKNIYNSLGYKVFFISAKENKGIDEIKKFIKNKTIMLCGLSGVGKTTLINSLVPDYMARTNEVSLKTQKGRHTTRHVELIKNNDIKIIDTPGFSCLKFDFILPEELINYFEDIKKYANCKFSNCLHEELNSEYCNVIKNLDKIEKTRYESYLTFLSEAKKYKKEISQKSIKKETMHKNTGNKIYTKISKRKRNLSRNVQKQSLGEI